MPGAFTAADFSTGTPVQPPATSPSAAGGWTTDDFQPQPPQPQSGAAHDTLWSSLANTGARILNSAGYGASQNWGSEPLGLSPDAEAGLRKAGIFNDYKTGHDSFIKSANEALIRPAAAVADFAMRGFGLPAAAGAVSGALGQARQEVEGDHPNVVQNIVGETLGMGGELAQGFAEGGLIGALGEGVPRAQETMHATEAARARSVGALGEGEGGFYGAEPLTPENVQARAEAAKDAGLDTPPTPTPPAPDIHVLARRIDPETFEQFDALAAERDQHRATIAALGEERENSPEVAAARADVDTILGKVNGVEDRLTKAAAQRLADAQSRLDDALHTDTPEMAEARSKLLGADFAMRDLAPDVSEAYRRAADMAPQLAEAPEEGGEQTAEKKPESLTETGETGGEQERVEPVAVAASGEAAGFEPPSVTGDEKLGEGTQVAEGTPKAGGQARYGNLRAVEGTGDLQARGLSENVEAKAIEDGLTSNFGDLPEYRTLSMKDQAAQVAKLMDADYEGAKAIAMGDRQPPKGVLPESVYVGVEKRALAEGDVDTLRQLATQSKLTTAGTTMGQRIRTLGERDQASPVGAIREVQAAREADLAKRTDVQAAKASEVAEIKKEVRAAASKKDAWNDFVAGIKC